MRRKIVILSILLFIGLVAAGAAAVFVALGHRGFRALEAANQAYAKGDWAEARRNYSWYLARQPVDEEILLRYAEVCVQVLNDRQEMLRSAAQAYIRLATLNESDREPALRAAEFCEKHALWIDLDYCTNTFLNRFPNDSRFKYWKALALQRLGDTAGAVERYGELVGKPDCPPEAYGARAILLTQQGLTESASSELNQAVERDSKNAPLLVQRARYFLTRDQLDAAEQDIKAAMALDPALLEGLLASIQLKLARQDWEGAVADAKAVLAAQPIEEAYVSLSRANYQLGKLEETVDAIAAADDVFLADHPTLYMILADQQLELERFRDAEHTKNAYRSAYPEHLAAFDFLEARELLKRSSLEDDDKAAKDLAANAAKKLEILVVNSPDSQPARLQLVLAYLQCGDREKARLSLVSHLQAFPADEHAKDLWEANFVSHSPQEVAARAEDVLRLERQRLEKAVEKDPSGPGPFKRLMAYYLDPKHSDIAKAQALLESARKNKMEPGVLNYPEAVMAFSQNDPAKAQLLLEKDLERPDVSSTEVGKWASLFAREGFLQVSLDMVQGYANRQADEGVRLGFEVDKVGYALLADDHERALALAREAEPHVAGNPGLMERLTAKKLEIAEYLVGRRDPENLMTAETIVSEVRAADDANLRAKLLEAGLLLQRDPPELEKADALCAALLNEGSIAPQVYMLKSDIWRARGRPKPALDFALKAQQQSPLDLPVQISVAHLQILCGKHKDAIETLASAQHNPAVLDLLVRAHAGAERFEEAQRYFDQLNDLVIQSPESDKALDSLRIWIAECRKDWPAAEQLARPQYEADPKDYGALHSLINSLDAQGRRAESELIMKHAAESAKTPELYTDLGRWYLGAADPESVSKASTAFTKALNVSTKYPPALLGLADVARLGSNIGTAIGLYDRYLETVPDDAGILLQKATLLATMENRRGEALDTLNRSVALTEQLPGGATAQVDVELAYAYLELGDKEKARAHYDTAKEKVAQGEKLDLPGRLEQLSSLLAESST